MHKVSVLIPVYNVDKYVVEAITSILNQSYKNIELVIVDDASTDTTLEKINKIAELNSNVKIIKNEVNSGITVALNNGLKHCTGDFIARADGDDIQHPNRIAEQIKFLCDNEDYGLVGCWIKNINEDGNETASCEYPTNYETIVASVKFTSPILHIWLARKAVYEKLGGYRNTNPAEDYDFVLRCIDYGIKVSNLPFYGSYIRLRNGSTMTESSLKQKIIFNYLKKKFLMGLINDTSVLENMPDIEQYKTTKKIHSLSTVFLKKGLERKKTVQGLFYLTFSLISPYTVQDIFRRLMFRRFINKSRLVK